VGSSQSAFENCKYLSSYQIELKQVSKGRENEKSGKLVRVFPK
jgi:hypothetical protein